MANDTGSIKSGIQFVSFKMDKIDFEVVQNLGVLSKRDHSDCEIAFDFGFRDALKFKKENHDDYVTGVQIQLSIKSKTNNQDIAHGTFVITGLFSSIGTLDKTYEEKIVKYQCPAILFPYIRAAISFTLSSAGFSTIVMPIVNVNAAAQDIDIKIIEQ